MPLMFIINGLVVAENRCNGIKQFFKKMLRFFVALYIPYLLWGYLFWGIKYFVYAGNESVSLRQGLQLCWNNSAWIPGWYLLVLLSIKILDLIIDNLIGNSKVRMPVWIVLFLLGGRYRNIYLLSKILQYGIYYQIGKQIKNMGVRENKMVNSRNCFAILSISAIMRFAGNWSYIMDFGIALSMSLIIVFLCSRSEHRSVIMEIMGEASMVPYVLHAYMTVPIRIVLQKCNCQDFAVYVLAETGAAILFSLIIIKCMKHFRWMRGLFYPAAVWRKESGENGSLLDKGSPLIFGRRKGCK